MDMSVVFVEPVGESSGGKVCEMVDHLVLLRQGRFFCKKSVTEILILLQKKTKKITASFESIEIENSKVKRINHALTRLFVTDRNNSNRLSIGHQTGINRLPY